MANFRLVLFCPRFSSVDSLSAPGTTTASPDTMLSGSGKKSARSKMKNTLIITSKKSSGSQSGMKMKVTPRGARKASHYPKSRLFFPTQKFSGSEGCSAPTVWFQTTDTVRTHRFRGGYCYTQGSGFAQPNLRLLVWIFL